MVFLKKSVPSADRVNILVNRDHYTWLDENYQGMKEFHILAREK